VQGLQELGWTAGRNVRVEYRFGLGDPGRLRKSAAELVALAPGIILAGGGVAVPALQQSKDRGAIQGATNVRATRKPE
jgi:putative ABC transport system substrate-binding protein